LETVKSDLKYEMFQQELQINEHSVKSIPENRLGLNLLPAAAVLWEKQSLSLPSHGCCPCRQGAPPVGLSEQFPNYFGSAQMLAIN